MKYTRLHIILFILIMILYSCAGKGDYQNNNMATKTLADEKSLTYVNSNATIEENVLENLTFSNADLSIKQLEAFELRAIQKFEDFTDYLEIISDRNIDTNLVNHSLILVEELFINDSVAIPPSDQVLGYESIDQKPGILIDYLNHIPKLHHPLKFHIKSKSIEFITPIRRDSTKNYKGVMKTTLIINHEKWIKNIDVHIVVIRKKFGNYHQDITEVRLGNIY